MRFCCFFIVVPILSAAPAFAQAGPGQKPQALIRVLDCRSVQPPEQRLACFDREVAALGVAEASRELIIVDRQQIRRTRRSLFGLALPDLGIFGDASSGEDAFTSLETTIRSASQSPYGKWNLTMQDGARWVQVDSRNLSRDPRPNDPIQIKRAAFGSYLANIDGQVAIRVRRER